MKPNSTSNVNVKEVQDALVALGLTANDTAFARDVTKTCTFTLVKVIVTKSTKHPDRKYIRVLTSAGVIEASELPECGLTAEEIVKYILANKDVVFRVTKVTSEDITYDDNGVEKTFKRYERTIKVESGGLEEEEE